MNSPSTLLAWQLKVIKTPNRMGFICVTSAKVTKASAVLLSLMFSHKYNFKFKVCVVLNDACFTQQISSCSLLTATDTKVHRHQFLKLVKSLFNVVHKTIQFGASIHKTTFKVFITIVWIGV